MKEYNYIRKSFRYDGKLYTVYGKTEKEAIIKMANKKRDLEEHKVALSGSTTVQEWSLKALESYKTNLKDITKEKYLRRLKASVIRDLGKMQLRDVKPIHCQNCLNNQAGKSKAQIDLVYQALQFVFSTAADNELIYKNPAEKIVKPQGYKNERRAITTYEKEHLIDACSNFDNGDLFLFMLYCGCRPSEAIHLQHKDFIIMDNAPMLHIRGTKTKNSDRYVPCPPELFKKYHRPGFDYIFTNSNGKIYDEQGYKRLTNRLYREMNISMGCRVYRNALIPPYPLATDFVPYDLRHTYCTELAKKGVDIRVAQKLMGHSTIQMTADIYTHVSNDDIVKVSNILFGDVKCDVK